MRKLKKILAIVLCLGITSGFSINANAKVKGEDALKTGKKPLLILFQMLNKHSVKQMITEGTVEDILQGKDGIMVLLNTNGNSTYEKINLTVNRSTSITSAIDGKKLTTSDIKKGMLVRAYYGPGVTKSIPPQSVARKIIVGIAGTDGTIISKTKTQGGYYVLVSGTKIGNTGYDKINLLISSKTQIINGADGSRLLFDNMKNNLSVKAYYSQLVNMSDPPIGGADKVVVDLLKTDGKITDIQRNESSTVITVEGNKKLSDGSSEKIILTIDSDTQFLGGNGAASSKDLKVGTIIKAYYGPVITMIYPPRTHAEFLRILK